MKRVIFMFPGQGSQAIGMGRNIYDTYPEIQTLYERANNVLNKNIMDLMFNGPDEQLTATENAQPALLLSSIATSHILEKEGVQPIATIGHSLGEYSALVAAGVLTLDAALPLVATRGKLMEDAFPKGQGAMAAVLGLTEEEITACLEKRPENEIVDMANINCPGQIVISGTQKGLESVEPILLDAGARRVIHLNVSGPFHSRLMKKASEEFSDSLSKVNFQSADIPVYANVTAQPVTDPNQIQSLLVEQLFSPVQFESSIRHMKELDADAFVEVGNGKVLSGLVRKIDRKIKTFSIQDQASLNKFLNWYKEDV
ncbi:MAG TPA: ACP S-malonyltransferase [Virgibacillus sp.]|nr:ACP S-malonyltransferase [Virgibacillus sp.]